MINIAFMSVELDPSWLMSNDFQQSCAFEHRKIINLRLPSWLMSGELRGANLINLGFMSVELDES